MNKGMYLENKTICDFVGMYLAAQVGKGKTCLRSWQFSTQLWVVIKLHICRQDCTETFCSDSGQKPASCRLYLLPSDFNMMSRGFALRFS
jgi:hypothetical protein